MPLIISEKTIFTDKVAFTEEEGHILENHQPSTVTFTVSWMPSFFCYPFD